MTTGISAYIEDVLYENFKKNRIGLEEKWRRNYQDYRRVIGAKGFRDEENRSQDKGKSPESEVDMDKRMPLARMKIVAAVSMIVDTALGRGDIPFSLEMDGVDETVLAEMPEEERVIELRSVRLNEAKIKDQIQRGKSDKHFNRMILSGGIYGDIIGYLTFRNKKRIRFVEVPKEPVIAMGQVIVPDGTDWVRIEEEEDVPALEYVSVWDVFRDYETEDPNECKGIIRRKMVSPSELRAKTGKEFWREKAILEAIENDANMRETSGEPIDSMTPNLRDVYSRENTIRLLMYTGRIPREIYDELDKTDKNELNVGDIKDDGDTVEVIAGVANGNLVYFAPPAYDGFRGWFFGKWEDDLDSTAGIGVADNVAPIQRVLDGVIQNFEQNKKLAASIILAMAKNDMGAWSGKIDPITVIELPEFTKDVREGIQQLTFADVGNSLLDYISILERWGDESSLIPKAANSGMAQGGRTAFEISQLMQGMGRYIGSVIRNLDEDIIEPFIEQCYLWNQEDPDLPVEMRGNFTVRGRGFLAYKNRVTRIQNINMILSMVGQYPDLASEFNVAHLARELALEYDLGPLALRSEADKQMDAERAAQERQAMLEEQLAIMQAKSALANQEEGAKHELRMEQGQQKAEANLLAEQMRTEKDLMKQGMQNDAALTAAAMTAGSGGGNEG